MFSSSSEGSSSESSSSDSVLSIHKSRVEINRRNSTTFPPCSYDPSTPASFPSNFDSMTNARYWRNYQENGDGSLEEEIEQNWQDNSMGSNSFSSDRCRSLPVRDRGTVSVPNAPARRQRQGTYAASPMGNETFAQGNRMQGPTGAADMDTTEEFYEKLGDHYTRKYLRSSAGAELKEYQRYMGMDDSHRRQSTFDEGRGGRDPNFSLSGIEGTGDPYANMLVDCEPTVYDAWEGSNDATSIDESYYSNLPSSFADSSGGGRDGTPTDIFNYSGRTASSRRSKSPKQSCSSGRSKSHGSPARGRGNATFAVPVDAQGSRVQDSSDSFETDSVIELNEKLNDHYTKRYLQSSAGAELQMYQRYMGMDDSHPRQSTFDEGRGGRDPNFSLSGIEGTGDPYANMLVDCEPTVYDAFEKSADTSYECSEYVSDVPASFSAYWGHADSGSGSVPREKSARGYSYMDRHQASTSMKCTDQELMENQRLFGQKGADATFDVHNFSGRSASSGRSKSPRQSPSSGRSKSPRQSPSSGCSKSPKGDSRKSSCCCSGESAEPPLQYSMQRHSSFDAQSTRQEPDFDLSAIEGEGDPYANLWQGSPSFYPGMPDNQDVACADVNRRLVQTPEGTKEYANLIEVQADCVKRKQISDGSSQMSGGGYGYLDRDQQQASMSFTNEEFLENQRYFEQEGQPFTPASTPRPRREIPRLKVTEPSPPSSRVRPPSAGSRIPVPVRRAPPAASRIPVPASRGREPPPQREQPAQYKPCPATVTVKPRAKPCPGTVTVKPRAKPCPATVTVQPKAKPGPGTVTVKPRARIDPATVTVQPRGPQAWPMYDPASVKLRPARPNSKDLTYRSRAKSAAPTPSTGSSTQLSRYHPSAYQPAQAPRPRSSEGNRPRWRGANAPPPAMSRPPSTRFVPYPPRSRTALARQASHERSLSEPPPQMSTQRHRAALGPPRITGYDPRVARKEPRPPLFQSPAGMDPNASLREEMAQMDKNSPEYRQLETLLAEAEGYPCDGSKQDDPNASLRAEMAMLDKNSPEYRQLETLLAEAEGSPSPEKPRKQTTAEDACAYIRAAMERVPHDSVQYSKLMVMLMDLQGWDGNSRPLGPIEEDPCEYIKAEMRNTDRNSTKYIQLEQMLLECEGDNSFAAAPQSPRAGSRSPPRSPETPRTKYAHAREDYFRMNPSVDGKRPTGMRKFSERYPRPDIDYDPMAGPPDYSAFFAGDSPRSSSPIQRTRDAEREMLARRSPPRAAPREFDERMRFHATSPRQADRWQHNPRPREPEFRRGYVDEDLSLPNPTCNCSSDEQVDTDPLFAKTRSLPFNEDLETRYKRN